MALLIVLKNVWLDVLLSVPKLKSKLVTNPISGMLPNTWKVSIVAKSLTKICGASGTPIILGSVRPVLSAGIKSVISKSSS